MAAAQVVESRKTRVSAIARPHRSEPPIESFVQGVPRRRHTQATEPNAPSRRAPGPSQFSRSRESRPWSPRLWRRTPTGRSSGSRSRPLALKGDGRNRRRSVAAGLQDEPCRLARIVHRHGVTTRRQRRDRLTLERELDLSGGADGAEQVARNVELDEVAVPSGDCEHRAPRRALNSHVPCPSRP